MPTQFKIRDVEQAILQVLRGNAAITAANIQVAGLSSKDWDDQGMLIAVPPAALLLYERTTDDGSNDNNRLTYTTYHEFSVFCGAQDLSSVDNERLGCYDVIAKVRAALAGARLTIDGVQTFPLELKGAAAEQFDRNGIWYSVPVISGMISQFA